MNDGTVCSGVRRDLGAYGASLNLKDKAIMAAIEVYRPGALQRGTGNRSIGRPRKGVSHTPLVTRAAALKDLLGLAADPASIARWLRACEVKKREYLNHLYPGKYPATGKGEKRTARRK